MLGTGGLALLQPLQPRGKRAIFNVDADRQRVDEQADHVFHTLEFGRSPGCRRTEDDMSAAGLAGDDDGKRGL